VAGSEPLSLVLLLPWISLVDGNSVSPGEVGDMTQDAAGTASQGTSNQDRLKGLRSEAPSAQPPGAADGVRAALPWEVPSSRISESSFGPGLGHASGAGANPSALPGVYPGSTPGDLRYWTGLAWDPRPVAPVWTRVWCWVIDNIIGGMVAFGVGVVLIIPLLLVAGDNSDLVNAAGVVVWIVVVIAYISYFALSYRIWGRTPGMMIGRLDVIRLDAGVKPALGPAYLRALVLVVAQVSGILSIIWIVVTSGNARRQGPHDSAAKTVVLRRPN